MESQETDQPHSADSNPSKAVDPQEMDQPQPTENDSSNVKMDPNAVVALAIATFPNFSSNQAKFLQLDKSNMKPS